MVRFPSFNHRRLAQALRSKPSTVTAARARLRGRCLFRRVNLPSFQALGAGVLSICHDGSPPTQAVGAGTPLPSDECDSFYALAGPSGWLEMGAFRDFTEAQRRGEWLRSAPGAGGTPCVRGRFPMERVRFDNFFDYSPLLSRRSPVREGAAGPRPMQAVAPRKLSAVERLVLYGLVRHPGATDGRLASALGVSRQGVARVRRLAFQEGLLQPAVLPSLEGLGLGLLALFHYRLDTGRPRDAQEAARQEMLRAVPHIFAISAGAESVLVGAYAGHAELEKASLGTLRRLGDDGLLDGAPAVRTFPVEGTSFLRDVDPAPFVKGALGLGIAD